MLVVTPVIAGIAAVALVGLSLAVSLRRMKVGTEIGTGDDPALLRRIRAHGNFVEYTPIGLILLGLAEHGGAGPAVTWTVAGLLVAGRLLHAVGMLTGATPPRAVGMIATYAALLAAAAALVL